jgi:hypothetical protein
MEKRIDQKWILLVHQLPPKPTNLRVRVWRKLQKLGAIVIKNSVYVLPFNDKTNEDFQWLKQEIESAGGEAALFHADSVGGATDEEIVSGFRKARDEEYAVIAAGLDGLTGTINEQKRGGHLSAGRVAGYEAELERLHKDLEWAIAIDFFNAPGRLSAVKAYERCLAALRYTQTRSMLIAKAKSTKSAVLDLRRFQGKRWVTRRNLFIDRLASIWLIKQFIDERPRFYFVSEGETIKGAIHFDMYGAEFTHRGEDCTFETMVNLFGFGDDAGLREIAEIVHDIDLKDDKFNRLEAPGLSAVIRGLAGTLNDDRKLIQQCNPIFDGLYESFNREVEQRAKGRRRERQTGNRVGRSGKRARGK